MKVKKVGKTMWDFLSELNNSFFELITNPFDWIGFGVLFNFILELIK